MHLVTQAPEEDSAVGVLRFGRLARTTLGLDRA